MKPSERAKARELVKKALCLSYRLLIFSPPMKPFIRFSRNQVDEFYSRRFWDFDDLLQKMLLSLVHEVTSPDRIVQLCLEQWESNLKGLHKRQTKGLEDAIHRDDDWGVTYNLCSDHKTEFYANRTKPGGRLLYIGCGSGTPCFRLAKKGLYVVGIDVVGALLDVAHGWATYLDLPVRLACVDAASLSFKSRSFDGFVMTVYGSLPTLSQTLALQRGLARVLKPGGRGIVAAMRKKYSSYWFLMGSPYSPAMTQWLKPQASADFFFSGTDGCEERLVSGLYNRSHTMQSLTSELSRTFEVEECFYDRDPRYVFAVVKCKKENKLSAEIEPGIECPEKVVSLPRLLEVERTLEKIESLCDQLKAHAEQVSAYFSDSPEPFAGSPFKSISPDLSGFTALLTDILESK